MCFEGRQRDREAVDHHGVGVVQNSLRHKAAAATSQGN